MSLRAKILIYLVAIHLLLGAVACIVLWDRRAWLLVAEALFAAAGERLLRAVAEQERACQGHCDAA